MPKRATETYAEGRVFNIRRRRMSKRRSLLNFGNENWCMPSFNNNAHKLNNNDNRVYKEQSQNKMGSNRRFGMNMQPTFNIFNVNVGFKNINNSNSQPTLDKVNGMYNTFGRNRTNGATQNKQDNIDINPTGPFKMMNKNVLKKEI
eukprot:UN30327